MHNTHRLAGLYQTPQTLLPTNNQSSNELKDIELVELIQLYIEELKERRGEITKNFFQKTKTLRQNIRDFQYFVFQTKATPGQELLNYKKKGLHSLLIKFSLNILDLIETQIEKDQLLEPNTPETLQEVIF